MNRAGYNKGDKNRGNAGADQGGQQQQGGPPTQQDNRTPAQKQDDKTRAIARNVNSMLEKSRKQFDDALRKLVDPAYFTRVCLTTFQRGGEKMLDAVDQNPRSFIGACMEAAQLGLVPDSILGECYLVPRKIRGVYHVQMLIGYQGMMKIARRSDQVLDIWTGVATEYEFNNNLFQVMLGTERFIKHTPYYMMDAAADPGATLAAYACAKLRDLPDVKFVVLPRKKLVEAAERSGSPFDKAWSDVWKDHFDPMSEKTAVRRLYKTLPLPDLERKAMQRDEIREESADEDSVLGTFIDAEGRESPDKTETGQPPRPSLGDLTTQARANGQTGPAAAKPEPAPSSEPQGSQQPQEPQHDGDPTG